MDRAGARGRASRVVAALRRVRTGAAMRALAGELAAAVRSSPRQPGDVRAVCRAVCDEMTARRGGRPVVLRFERFPDEIDVTGLWVEFQDFDLVIVEERAEAVQQLVILGHELWHLHTGHGHRHGPGATAARALADRSRRPGTGLGPGLFAALEQGGTPVAARDGSRECEEAEADDFGHLLATALRCLAPAPAGDARLDPVQRSLGYRGRGGAAR
jgi:hypothetical protein